MACRTTLTRTFDNPFPIQDTLLRADILVDFVGGAPSTCVDITIQNNSTVPMGQTAQLDQLLFNLAGFDSESNTQLTATFPPGVNWSFETSSGPPPGGFDHNSGGCGQYQYLVNANSNADRLGPGESFTFRLCSNVVGLQFTENTFLLAPVSSGGQDSGRVAVSFQSLGPGEGGSACIADNFDCRPVTTAPPTTAPPTTAPPTTAPPTTAPPTTAPPTTAPPVLRPECIRTIKVFDWIVDVNRYTNKVPIPPCVAVAEAVGTGNGKTTVFQLDNFPVIPLSETVYVDGAVRRRGIDYTVNYATGRITFTDAPCAGEDITADYEYDCVANARRQGLTVTFQCTAPTVPPFFPIFPAPAPSPDFGCEVVSVTNGTPGRITVVFTAVIRITLRANGRIIRTFDVPVEFTDEFAVCIPAPLTADNVFCRITQINCSTNANQVLGNMLSLSVVICKEVQVEAQVKLEVLGRFCQPRSNDIVPTTPAPPQCPPLTFPPQCPDIFPRH
ncbi:hypothetical protein J2S09_004045 [Bacillus fengqiuensis]|nr:hypothetical protein [Bacillus fengqiuensis]